MRLGAVSAPAPLPLRPLPRLPAPELPGGPAESGSTPVLSAWGSSVRRLLCLGTQAPAPFLGLPWGPEVQAPPCCGGSLWGGRGTVPLQPRLLAPVVLTRPGLRAYMPPLEPLPSPAQVVSSLGLSPAHLEALSETSLPRLRLSLALSPCFLQDFCCHSLLPPPEGINSSPGLGAQAHLVWGPPSLRPAGPWSGCKPSGLERPSLPHVGLLEWRRGAEASV